MYRSIPLLASRPAKGVGLLIVVGGALILLPAVVVIEWWLYVLVVLGGPVPIRDWPGIAFSLGWPSAVACLGIVFVLYGARLAYRGLR